MVLNGQIKINTEIRAILLCILVQIFNELKEPLRMLQNSGIFFRAYIIINEWDKCVAEIFLVIFDICNHPIEISMR